MNNTNADKMKSKELRKIIREAIADVLAEATVSTTIDYKDKNKGDKILDIDATDMATFNKLKSDPTVSSATAGTKKIKEGDIDELARIAKGYKLADDNVDTSGFTKTISGTSLADVIEYFKENPGADKKSLQSQFNFARPQIANAIVNGLMDAGVLVKLGAGGEEEPAGTQAQAPAATDAEDMFVGGADNPLAMYFDGEPNDDGSEDFEPEEDAIEKAEPVAASNMSDEEFDAWLTYKELERRLAATKSNILKSRKSRPGAGDIKDQPGTEVERLRALKSSLEDRMAALIAKFPSVKDGAKEPEDLEMPDTEEEPLQEMDQYDINKLKFYAGIVK